MTQTKTRILVVEDEILLRRNLAKKISSLPDLPVVVAGEAADGKTAFDMIKTVCPDIIITDIRMPVMDGLELIEKTRRFYPLIEYILLSSYGEFEYAKKAIELRVSEYLLKPVKIEELKKAVINIISKKELNGEIPEADADLNRKDVLQKLSGYIEQNYRSQISLSELSCKFGYSIEYLGRIFKENMHMTPSEYITYLRIENAKKVLLQYPDMDVYKIARICGSGDNSGYFSRIFRRQTGVQPSEFRKKELRKKHS